MNRSRNDELMDGWRSEAACLSGLATPIRHRSGAAASAAASVDKTRLQEILCSSEWDDLAAGSGGGPLRNVASLQELAPAPAPAGQGTDQ